jgi:hypothetical protein
MPGGGNNDLLVTDGSLNRYQPSLQDSVDREAVFIFFFSMLKVSATLREYTRCVLFLFARP